MRIGSEERFARADANLVASLRAPTRWQGDRAEVREEGGLLLVAGSRRFPAGMMNCAVRLDSSLTAATALERAASFFAARDRGFSWYLRDPVDADLIAATTAAGLATIATLPWMTLDRPLPEVALAAGVTLRFADGDPRLLADAVAVRADAYQSAGLPGAITSSLFATPPRTADDSRIVVAYAGGAPAATAQLIPTDGVAGVYWVATTRAMRRRALAEACTRAVTNAGFAAGAAFATLQASAMGEPLYTRLGFATRWQSRCVLVSREQAAASNLTH